jgi:hypothetical protein
VLRTGKCPDCGAEIELPPLQLVEGFGAHTADLYCDNCHWFGTDESFKTQRPLLVWSGGDPGPFIVTPLGGFEGFFSDTAVSPTGIDLKHNELFIAIFGNVGGDGVAPTSVTLGVSDVLTPITDSGASEPCISMSYFMGHLSSPGLQTLTAIYPRSVDTALCLMLKISGCSSSPIDGSSSLLEAGSAVTWTSGNTAPLTAFNELAIGAFVSEHAFDEAGRPTFGNGFTQQQFLQAENPSAIFLAQATRQLQNKTPIACKGTKQLFMSGSYSVVTIKPR